ncbi:MAG: InlB B-repeat-containing protein, partial [Clostridia bacterium]
MHKRKFILGLLIILAMAICGVWLTDTRPLVFAVETPNALVETVIDDAGTFSGKGFYVKGETANLKAEMNLGYEFDGWYNGDTLLSANVEHSFTVESDIEITYKWHRIEYSVDFADNDYFDITINNNTEAGNIYYYNNQLQITITTKPNLYVYDLTSEDISLNGISIADWISGTNSMSIGYVSHNNNNEGFKSYTFNLTIKEDVTIDVAYTKMFKLTIVSGNRIDIDNVINFLTINSYYSKLNNTNYLVRAGQSVNIILSSGNSVYHLHSAGIPSEVANMNQNRFYTLTEDTTFTVTYVKQGYNVSFTPYLINLYDNIDPMISPLLYGEISDVRLTAGDSVEFAYDAGSRAITIAGSEYTYNPTIYGYKFVKFEVDGVDKGVNGTYTLSDSEPTDVEIKLIFEYIEYTDVSIALVDNFFTGNYKTTITYSNSKLITGTDVSISALIENKFIDSRVIKGWSAINTPIIDADYLKMANTDATSDTYTFTFEPTSDDENISITIYLDIDYKYYSSTYSLSTRSITITEVVYDQIVIDKQNNKITFVDTANEDNNAEEVVADASASQIISTNLGELVIIGDELKYIKDGIEIKSTSKSTEGDIDVYSFTKNTYYTYWGELETGVVEYIKLVENGEDIKVELYGNKYSLALYTTDVILQEFETTRTLLREDIYTINAIDTGYTMLYKSGEYLELNGVKYKYDSSNSCYKLEASTGTNKPINVSAGIIQNDDEYNITLNNLMADSIIIYSTMSKNSGKYAFTHFVDQTSSTLGSFNYGEHYYTIQKGTMVEVKSSFKQLDGSITLIINDLNAYVYENISISVKHGGTTSGTTGNSITAQDGDLITIIINEEDISLGYEFVDYVFNGGVLSRDGYTCEFTMIMATYQNGTININFKPIDYIVNINVTRVDSNTTEENTGVKLQGGNFTSQVIVNISHLYTFVAETITGYYVDIANINEEYGITDLLRDNSSGDILTTWTLNSTNFIEAIINNANEDKEVNLNVGFTIHTYSVTVYYKLSNHKDSVSYPSIKIGGTETNPIAPTGEGNYYHYVVADGFEYGGDVVLQSSNYMVGLRRVSWQDALERELLQSDNYTILSIKSDIRLYLYLEFIYYEWDIEIINPSEANSNGYSNNVPKPRNACYKDRVTFNINPDAVSVLSNIQYIDASGVATPFDLPNGDLVFEFIPANFKIQDGKIKIVFTFTLKMFNFSISNNISSADLKASYFTEKNGYNQDNIVEYSLKVTRDGNNNSLEAIEGKYNVQALDKIYIYIYPVSVGIHVNSINLGGIVFSTLSGNNDYKLMQYNDGPKDKPIYYLCIVEFNSAVMQQLRYTVDAGTKSISIDIVNNMVLRTYTINYTCNYIETFSIKLRYKRMWGALSNITIIGSEKNSLTIPDNNAGQALAK